MQTYVQRKTEQKKKQFTVYSSVYVYIYIYIYNQTSALFLNHYTLFYFSHVNLQLKVRANEEEVLGTLVPVVLLLLSSFHLTWNHGQGERRVITQTNCQQSMGRVDTFFNFLRTAGWGGSRGYQTYDASLQMLLLTRRQLRSHTRCFVLTKREYCPSMMVTWFTMWALHHARQCRALLCGTQIMAILGCVVASLDLKGKC